jgi:hypothetical protein
MISFNKPLLESFDAMIEQKPFGGARVPGEMVLDIGEGGEQIILKRWPGMWRTVE